MISAELPVYIFLALKMEEIISDGISQKIEFSDRMYTCGYNGCEHTLKTRIGIQRHQIEKHGFQTVSPEDFGYLQSLKRIDLPEFTTSNVFDNTDIIAEFKTLLNKKQIEAAAVKPNVVIKPKFTAIKCESFDGASYIFRKYDKIYFYKDGNLMYKTFDETDCIMPILEDEKTNNHYYKIKELRDAKFSELEGEMQNLKMIYMKNNIKFNYEYHQIAYDIETFETDPAKMNDAPKVDSETARVCMIQFTHDDGENIKNYIFTLKAYDTIHGIGKRLEFDDNKVKVIYYDTETLMCQGFFNYIAKLKTMVVCYGYNSNSTFQKAKKNDQEYYDWINQEPVCGYDLPFINDRSGYKFRFDRAIQREQQSFVSEYYSIELPNALFVDAKILASHMAKNSVKLAAKMKDMKLNTVLKACDIEPKHDAITIRQMQQEWREPSNREHFMITLEYGIFDTILLHRLVNQQNMLNDLFQSAVVIDFCMMDACRFTGAKMLCERFHIESCQQMIYYPKPNYEELRDLPAFEGATNFNLNSERNENRIYEDVTGLDFTSQFPSIMMSLNISPETCMYAGLERQEHLLETCYEIECDDKKYGDKYKYTYFLKPTGLVAVYDYSCGLTHDEFMQKHIDENNLQPGSLVYLNNDLMRIDSFGLFPRKCFMYFGLKQVLSFKSKLMNKVVDTYTKGSTDVAAINKLIDKINKSSIQLGTDIIDYYLPEDIETRAEEFIPQLQTLQSRYMSIKGYFNTIYGVLGAKNYYFYLPYLALTVTCLARKSTIHMRKVIDEQNLAIMGDTDSCYAVLKHGNNIEELRKYAETRVQEEFGLYRLFLEADPPASYYLAPMNVKKCYVYMTVKDKEIARQLTIETLFNEKISIEEIYEKYQIQGDSVTGKSFQWSAIPAGQQHWFKRFIVAILLGNEIAECMQIIEDKLYHQIIEQPEQFAKKYKITAKQEVIEFTK